MWTCPKCREAVEDEFEVCWSCGTNREGHENPDFVPEQDGIMTESTYQAEQATERQEDLVTVALFANATEAHMARSLLEAEGIHGFVMDELANVVWGFKTPLDAVPLQVADKDVDRARALLAEVHHTPPPEDDAE
jgi:hypothetical protein